MPPHMSNLAPAENTDCLGRLHPDAVAGMELFNHGEYFAAHEALEAAWREERGPIRELYRGILQAAVVYLHILRGNYAGAFKVYQRSRKWLDPWPETCRGVAVGQLRRDLGAAITSMQALGPERIERFDRALIKPVTYARQ